MNSFCVRWLELLPTTSRYVPALFESSSVPVIVIIIIIINYKSRRKRRTLVASVEGGVGRGKPRYFGLLAFATRELSIAAEHCIINYCFYPRAPISWGLYHTHTHAHTHAHTWPPSSSPTSCFISLSLSRVEDLSRILKVASCLATSSRPAIFFRSAVAAGVLCHVASFDSFIIDEDRNLFAFQVEHVRVCALHRPFSLCGVVLFVDDPEVRNSGPWGKSDSKI